MVEEMCSCAPSGPEIDCPVHGANCVCGRRIGVHSAFSMCSFYDTAGNVWFAVEGCGELSSHPQVREWWMRLYEDGTVQTGGFTPTDEMYFEDDD